MRAVIVTWHDAHADGAWMTTAEVDGDPYVVRSIGWELPNVKPGHFSLAQSRGHADTWDNILHIPTGMVVRVQSVLSLPKQMLR